MWPQKKIGNELYFIKGILLMRWSSNWLNTQGQVFLRTLRNSAEDKMELVNYQVPRAALLVPQDANTV